MVRSSKISYICLCYCSAKWKGYIIQWNVEIQHQVAVSYVDDEVKNIMSRIYTRKAARNNSLICGMTCLGHCTKAFSTLTELAVHMYGKYGSDWYNHLKTKQSDGTTTPNRKKANHSVAPDLESLWTTHGQLCWGLRL